MSRLRSGFDAASSGCYEASRAAALSGVPERTVYDWARKGVVVPSVSPVQEKLWSYADLMSLRVVAWLRRPKQLAEDTRLPANPMSQVRSALDLLARSNVALWTEEAPSDSPVVIDERGSVFVRVSDHFLDLGGNVALPHEQRFGLLNPFELDGLKGPDLRRPRPDLRIVPSRVAGEPHVVRTRITTQTLLALHQRGFSIERVAAMYGIEQHVIEQAVDLESALAAA
jgi:uncharacterized protein (DUF433 family)